MSKIDDGGWARADRAVQDFGVCTAQVLCRRLGGRVLDHTPLGTRGTLTIRLPAQSDRLWNAMSESRRIKSASRQLVTTLVDNKESMVEALARNTDLRSSGRGIRESAQRARLETIALRIGGAGARTGGAGGRPDSDGYDPHNPAG